MPVGDLSRAIRKLLSPLLAISQRAILEKLILEDTIMELFDMLLKGMGGGLTNDTQDQQLQEQLRNQQEQLRQQQYQASERQQQNAGIPNLDLGDISRQLNLSPNQVQDVLKMALPLMLGKIGQNTQSDEGANSLSRALDNHANRQYRSAQDIDENDGKGILGHIFGNRGTDEVSREISEKAGVDKGSSMKILAMLAPLALAYLAKKKKNDNLDESGVRDLTRQYSDEMNQRSGGSLYDALKQLPDDNNEQQQGLGGGLLGGILGGLLGR